MKTNKERAIDYDRQLRKAKRKEYINLKNQRRGTNYDRAKPIITVRFG